MGNPKKDKTKVELDVQVNPSTGNIQITRRLGEQSQTLKTRQELDTLSDSDWQQIISTLMKVDPKDVSLQNGTFGGKFTVVAHNEQHANQLHETFMNGHPSRARVIENKMNDDGIREATIISVRQKPVGHSPDIQRESKLVMRSMSDWKVRINNPHYHNGELVSVGGAMKLGEFSPAIVVKVYELKDLLIRQAKELDNKGKQHTYSHDKSLTRQDKGFFAGMVNEFKQTHEKKKSVEHKNDEGTKATSPKRRS